MPLTTMPRVHRGAAIFVLVAAGILPAACGRTESNSPPPTSTSPTQAILPVAEIEPGMRGYGLTVFRGAKVEPFPVEVISVMDNYMPGKSVVWIRCPGVRMQGTGPVSGMSGSPIYLWGNNEPHRLGQGGRLIGAFAYGYRLSRDCYAGVQTIEQMRRVGDRMTAEDPESTPPSASGRGGRPELLRHLHAATVDEAGNQSPDAWRIAALAKACGITLTESTAPTGTSRAVAGPDGRGLRPLLLPVPVANAELARLVGPLFEQLGLGVQAAAGGSTSPPPGIDADAIELQPGSVLSVPLGWGDTDLAASGTVTDVLPDGRVLGFGHAMTNRGSLALPMATGYVHFIQPSIDTSFKLSGTARVRGALLRDEFSAVAGRTGATFGVGDAVVNVALPHRDPLTYQYQFAIDPQYTPVISAYLVLYSLMGHQGLPLENTMRVTARLQFGQGRQIDFEQTYAMARGQEMLRMIAGPFSAMMQNPFESVEPERLEVNVEIEPTVRQCNLLGASLDRAELAPGETLTVYLRLLPYQGEPFIHPLEIELPDHLVDGTYSIMVGDAQMYGELLRTARPHLLLVEDLDDLQALVELLFGVRQDALYAVVPLPEPGLAIGRTELPQLPSSRMAILASETSTAAMPVGQWLEKIEPAPFVVSGRVGFQVTVRRDARRDAGEGDGDG
jgi:hypothetical protein